MQIEDCPVIGHIVSDGPWHIECASLKNFLASAVHRCQSFGHLKNNFLDHSKVSMLNIGQFDLSKQLFP